MSIWVEGIRYTIANLRLLVPPLVIFLSIVICQRFYERWDKKVFWLVGFLAGILSYFLANVVYQPFDWWVLN